MRNYIPNETKVFDDQNPHWMNVEIEKLITPKNKAFKKYLQNNCILTNIKCCNGN